MSVDSLVGPRARRSAGSSSVRRADLLINMALYQGGWVACVFAAAAGRAWLGAAVGLALAAAHLGLTRDRGRELALMLAAAVVGLAVDSAQLNLGLFDYPGGTPIAGLAPPWIAVLWLQFATLLHFGLRWLSRRYLLAGMLGLVGGPLSFYAGERAGAIEFAGPGAYLALGVVWSGVMPLLVWLADRLEPRRGGYR